MINSYPKVWNLGHPQVEDILSGDVTVEEKVDGSQFSIARVGGELYCRSRGKHILKDEPAGMFDLAMETALLLHPHLHEGWVYRGEYLRKPKHNSLAYDRVPASNFIIFDIQIGLESYLDYDAKHRESQRLGLEVVPRLMLGHLASANALAVLLDSESCLGGQKIEGVVVKNYSRFGHDGKVLMAKHVSEAYRETHRGDWKKRNPGQSGVLEGLCAQFRSEARWQKAVQHMAENETLEHSPRDIGRLVAAVQEDVQIEGEEEVKVVLARWAMPAVKRASTRGLAEWYKDQLMQRQFQQGD